MIDITNKCVKSPSLGLLCFFFPEYSVQDEFMLYGPEKVIYKGPAQFIRKYRDAGITYIALNGVPEYDLTNRGKLLEFVYSKFDREPPKYLDEMKDMYDEESFIDCCKQVWVTGQWPYKMGEDMISIFDLYSSLVGGTSKAIETLMLLLKSTRTDIVESSLLTFLMRVKSLDEQSVSPNYMRILRTFNNSYYRNIKPAVSKLISTNIDNEELKLFEFVTNLIHR